MSAEPTELGDDAATEELGVVSVMSGRLQLAFGDGRGGAKEEGHVSGHKQGHSRLAFLHVGLLVTASEGEELVVDVRHGG
jgi:hypothetical protein